MPVSGATILATMLGAPDNIIVDPGPSQVDLGGTTAGCLFTYMPKFHVLEIDQTTVPLNVWRTAEEYKFELTMVEISAQKLMFAMNYAQAGIVTTAAGTLAPAAAPVITTAGAAGAATCSYQVVYFSSSGDAVPSPAGTLATCNAVQTATNYNIVTFAAAPVGAIGVKIIRSVGGASQGLISTIYGTTATVLNDTGLVATPYVAATVAPATPTVDTMQFGGQLYVPIHTLYMTVPKNDGTPNHFRYSFWKCYVGSHVPLDHKRDKNTEYKIEILGLADLSKPVGQQLFQLARES